jgi:regulator of G-protein signaling
VSEFSEENIAFYLACEDYRITKPSSKLSATAKKIYEEYVCSDAPREVTINIYIHN